MGVFFCRIIITYTAITMVNLEVKGTLAKLLATEDLIIEHRNVSTASFDVDRRVLTLPRWEKASSMVFDLLIAHEVGHAIFTPADDWNEIAKVPGIYINIAEDARIEKLIKTRFGGLPKTFYNGYKELYDDDFFGIADEDISQMSIADRVNLYFKIGHFINVPFFTEEEHSVVGSIQNANTFEEMVYAAEALYKLHEQQKEENQDQQQDFDAPAPESNENSESNETEDQQPQNQSEQQESQSSDDSGESESDDSEVKEESEPTNSGGDHYLSEDIKTVDKLSEKLESLTSSHRSDPVYLEIPTADLKKICVDNGEIYTYINDTWEKHIIRTLMESRENRSREDIEDMMFKYPRLRYQEFRKDIQSEVNYMVKEFECKKSADAYARASTSRTGVLDCTKLHTYKYNEDLFKKVTTLPNGKNHGLVFVLDWSGSMCHVIEDTVRQLLSVVMFCDKVNIPFDVYTFTNEWAEGDNGFEYGNPNEFHYDPSFSLLNVLTSRTSRKELNRQMETLYMIAAMFTYNYGTCVPSRVGLSGTPLNEALMTLRTLLPDFKSRTGVEKAHVMVLTDGESAQSRYVREYDVTGGTPQKGLVRVIINSNCYIRNRKTGVTSWLGSESSNYVSFTKFVLDDLKDMFPESTFTGIRILESSNGYFIRQATNYDDQQISKWKKEKTVTITDAGYDKYFIISNNQLQQSTEFQVDDDASKAKIKSAFAKSLKSKKVNKKILSDFIDLIA